MGIYNDPQNAPDTWTVEVRRMLDIDGVELVLYRDQDGVTHVMDAEDFDWKGPRP